MDRYKLFIGIYRASVLRLISEFRVEAETFLFSVLWLYCARFTNVVGVYHKSCACLLYLHFWCDLGSVWWITGWAIISIWWYFHLFLGAVLVHFLLLSVSKKKPSPPKHIVKLNLILDTALHLDPCHKVIQFFSGFFWGGVWFLFEVPVQIWEILGQTLNLDIKNKFVAALIMPHKM